jgi:hypothetical protein
LKFDKELRLLALLRERSTHPNPDAAAGSLLCLGVYSAAKGDMPEALALLNRAETLFTEGSLSRLHARILQACVYTGEARVQLLCMLRRQDAGRPTLLDAHPNYICMALEAALDPKVSWDELFSRLGGRTRPIGEVTNVGKPSDHRAGRSGGHTRRS